jgi:2-dehydropantoate 2-reductase
MEKNSIALMGLGVVGAPLANLLYKQYSDNFALLSTRDFLHTLIDKPIYINGEKFNPKIIAGKEDKQSHIKYLFICVKNYHVDGTMDFLKEVLDNETVIFPLQNGVYSFDFFSRNFPRNIVLAGFAKGPNTALCENGFVYQRAGSFHVGSSNPEWCPVARDVCRLMTDAGVDCVYDDDVTHEVWKKFMLNVAGNAITALTGIDYAQLKNSPVTQELCVEVMREFISVAARKGVMLGEDDIHDVINYYLSFNVSKHTSMLEDVLNARRTENEYIAGYISRLASEMGVLTPRIDTLYRLMKIKEDVYMKRLK